jgi:hypothetical protein
MWLGVAFYADDTSATWVRVFQLAFGVALAAWAVRKTGQMITKA